MSDDIRLEKDDVTVEEAPDYECDECTSSDKANFVVLIDFRSIGTTQTFGRYCKDCAENIAGRIRDGLPTAAPQEREGESKTR